MVGYKSRQSINRLSIYWLLTYRKMFIWRDVDCQLIARLSPIEILISCSLSKILLLDIILRSLPYLAKKIKELAPVVWNQSMIRSRFVIIIGKVKKKALSDKKYTEDIGCIHAVALIPLSLSTFYFSKLNIEPCSFYLSLRRLLGQHCLERDGWRSLQ